MTVSRSLEMAADFSPAIPNLTIDAIMDPVLDSGGQRELYRRYRKRRSSSGFLFPQEAESSPDPHEKIHAVRGDFVKEEFSPIDDDYQRVQGSRESTRWSTKPPAGLGLPSSHILVKSLHEDQEYSPHLPLLPAPMPSLKAVKQEQEEISDSGESSFSRFAFSLTSSLQGMMSFPELILRFEACCEELADLVREEATERHRAIEDRLMRQKAQMLQGESATWALIWHLFGKGSEDMNLEDGFMSTSQHEACAFIMINETAQLCHRIVQWLEGLACKALDLEKKCKGWYAGSYLQRLGVWHQTQRAIKKMAGKAVLVQHLDPDAPTREHARLEAEDQKLEEGLLEDLWKLLRAGRLEEARQLCRSAGQPWRAATLGGCGAVGPSPSPDMLRTQGNDLSLHAVELESGIGHQRRLWKWACLCASERIGDKSDESRLEAAIYAAQCGNIRKMLPVCRDWESACWAMVKSWLDVQVDMEIACLHPVKGDQVKFNADSSEMNDAIVEFNMEPVTGPESWPQHVLDQQPRDLASLFQKLQSGDLVHESVSQSCKEQQHQVQMCIMLGDIGHLLELLKAWIVPPEDGIDTSRRSHGHPQMIRFGAHLVLVLRHILADDIKEQFREKLWLVGDLILNTYAIFLFTQRREELVGIYAAQLAPYLCEELYVHMMELRQNDSVLVKQKLFRSALENLPFSAQDGVKGCVSNIVNRILSRSREIRREIRDVKHDDAEDYLRERNLQKAVAVQWLCFAPPSVLSNSEELRAELLTQALQHSNILFREFALTTLSRNTKMPVGAHMLLGYLVDPFKEPIEVSQIVQHNMREKINEFQEWRDYFTCDALYRSWLKIEMSNAQIPDLSLEERERAATAANQAIGAATTLLQGKGYGWLTGSEFVHEDPESIQWMTLDAVATLHSPSGNCMVPDAIICTALRSALYSCVGEDIVMRRQLLVEISVNGVDENCINVHLQCLPVKGDGIGPCSGSDGGLLAAIMATAVKGEVDNFLVGVTLEVAQLNAWYIERDGKHIPADYIVQGLCRRCCLPEIILRWMQMTVYLVDCEFFLTEEEELVESIASSENELHRLFSCRQLQEFLLLERDYTLQIMELAETEQQQTEWMG